MIGVKNQLKYARNEVGGTNKATIKF